VRGSVAPMMRMVVFAGLLTACGAGRVALPPHGAAVSPRPLFLDVAEAHRGSRGLPERAVGGVQTHLERTLASYGYQVTDRYSDTGATLRLLAVDRNRVSAELIADGRAITIVGNAESCTSTWWGIYATENERCLARALVAELFALPLFAAAFDLDLMRVEGAPGSVSSR